MAWGKIIFLHFQAVQPACRVPGHGEMITPPKSDYNPSNKMVTLSVQGCILILCFLHFIFCVKPKGNFFFLFENLGVQRLKYSSRCLRKVGKESNLLLPSEGCASFLCAGPRWFLGLIPPLSLAGSRNHAPILWNKQARVSSLLQLWKDPFSHIVDGYLELCSKIQSQGKNCSENWNGPAASHPPPKTLIKVPGAPRPQTTESWSLIMLASLFLELLWNMWSISQAREFCCSPWGVLPLPEPPVRVICVWSPLLPETSLFVCFAL